MVAFPAAALISAGGSVLSSIFGNKQPKVMKPKDQIKSTVEGAREAGIHPLAALGSGAGYTQISGGSNVGSAIGAGMDKLGQMMASQKSEAEIDALKASTDAQRAQAELYRSQSRSLIQKTQEAARGGPPVNDQLPGVKPIRVGGVEFRRDPNYFSSAQDAQDEYGDIVEQIVGTGAFAQAGGKKVSEWMDRNIPTDRQLLEAAKRWYDKSFNYRFNKGNYRR